VARVESSTCACIENETRKHKEINRKQGVLLYRRMGTIFFVV
jgi:hypothetical protein